VPRDDGAAHPRGRTLNAALLSGSSSTTTRGGGGISASCVMAPGPARRPDPSSGLADDTVVSGRIPNEHEKGFEIIKNSRRMG
jgi:hypothetical protein